MLNIKYKKTNMFFLWWIISTMMWWCHVMISGHDLKVFDITALWQRPSISHQHTGARMSVKRRRNHKWAFIEVCPAAATVHGTLMWSHHVGAGTSKRHVSGVKLKSVDGSWMFPIQHSHLHPTLSAPNMDSPVLWACTTRDILTQMSQE